jgi:hypothetical protein
MEIGKPLTEIIVEPIEEPVPQEEPAEPVPSEEPAKPDAVPA